MVEEQVKAGSAELPELCFRDLEAAVVWLCNAFGFSEVQRTTGDDGRASAVRLACEDQTVDLKRTPGDAAAGSDQKRSSGDREPQSYYLLVDDVEKIYRSATAAGVDIVFDNPAVAGARRSFACRDIEGHIWFFGQRVIELAGSAPPPPKRAPLRGYVAAAGIFLFLLTGVVVSLHVASTAQGLLKIVAVAPPPATPQAPVARPNRPTAPVERRRTPTQEPVAHDTIGQDAERRADGHVVRRASKAVAHLRQQLAHERLKRAAAEQQRRAAETRLRTLVEKADDDARHFTALAAKIKTEKARQAALSQQLAELRSRLSKDHALTTRSGNDNDTDADAAATTLPGTAKAKPGSKKKRRLNAEEVYARLERSAQVLPQPITAPPRIADKSKSKPFHARWRRVAKQWSPLFSVTSLTLKLRAADRLIRIRAMKHDVRVLSAEVVYANGRRRRLPLGGRIEDGYWTRTLSLGVTAAPVRRITVQHQTTFNPKGPGWVEVWVR